MTHYLTFSLQNLPAQSVAIEAARYMGAGTQASVMDYFTTTDSPINKQLPNSAIWVDGKTSAGGGAWVDGSGDIRPDDEPIDGIERPVAVIDLFSMLSAKLGRQIAQEKIAYVESIGIRVVNSGYGESNNNNEQGAGFAGTLAWYAPKKDRIRAYKLYRTAHRIMGKDDLQDNFLFSPDNRYKALRVGPFNHPTSGYPTVIDQTNDMFNDVTGAKANLTEIFTAYDVKNNVIDGTSGTGAPQKGLPANKHWTSGRCLGTPDSMHFTVGVANPKSGAVGAGYTEWMWAGPQISLMNGLLVLSIDDSSTTDSWTNATWEDEEFRIEVCVGIKGWKGIA